MPEKARVVKRHTGYLQIHLDLFINFPNDRIFQAFTRLHEAGQGGEMFGAPLGISAQQAGILVGYQYDDGRINSGKGFARAFLIAAYHAVTR